MIDLSIFAFAVIFYNESTKLKEVIAKWAKTGFTVQYAVFAYENL